MIEDAQEREWFTGRGVTLCLALRLAVLLCPAVAHAQSVAFINPGKSDELYWVTATQGMQAVANSFGMTFEVQYAQREPLKTLEIAREMVARPAGKRPEHGLQWNGTIAGDDTILVIAPDAPTAEAVQEKLLELLDRVARRTGRNPVHQPPI